MLGTKNAAHAEEGAAGVTESDARTSAKLASAQRQQKILQWVLSALTCVLIVMGAQQGEQQRPVAGLLESIERRWSALALTENALGHRGLQFFRRPTPDARRPAPGRMGAMPQDDRG